MPRDPWQSIWRLATSRAALVVLLGALAVSLALTAWFPQIPAGGGVLYAQRLSEAHLRFGAATDALQRLGFLTITRSVGFRVLLALLAACLILHTVDHVESLHAHREPRDDETATHFAAQLRRLPGTDVCALCTSVGGLLILAGLLVNTVWGWQEESITLQNSNRVPLSHGASWVAWEPGADHPSHSPGMRAAIQATGPGFAIQAIDDTGNPLQLQQSPTSAPVTLLTLALTEDRYFAVPETGLVVRLSANGGPDAESDAPVSVQVYGSPSGQLVVEAEVTGDAVLAGEGVTLQFISAPFAQVTVRFTPGRWAIIGGSAILIVGALGWSLAMVRRRLGRAKSSAA